MSERVAAERLVIGPAVDVVLHRRWESQRATVCEDGYAQVTFLPAGVVTDVLVYCYDRTGRIIPADQVPRSALVGIFHGTQMLTIPERPFADIMERLGAGSCAAVVLHAGRINTSVLAGVRVMAAGLAGTGVAQLEVLVGRMVPHMRA